jgi:hypothetical protein
MSLDGKLNFRKKREDMRERTKKFALHDTTEICKG